MNPVTLQEALVLAKASDYKNVVLAPPFPFIEEVGKVLIKAELGAQDLSWAEKGALTGEVSAKELKDIGVKYVIVGHSERRHKLGETNEVVAKKLKAAVENNLIPVLCVGETKEEKDAGKKEEVIKRQLKIGLSKLTNLKTYKLKNLLIAYEPVWAIGTGDPETPASALKTIQFIKINLKTYKLKKLQTKVLYGGSVNSQNLKDFLQYEEVDGALVGGAGLKKEEVKKMMKLVPRI